jgi:hypothetical protein
MGGHMRARLSSCNPAEWVTQSTCSVNRWKVEGANASLLAQDVKTSRKRRPERNFHVAQVRAGEVFVNWSLA